MKNFKSYELKIKARSLALEGELIHQNEIKLKKQILRCKVKITQLSLDSSSTSQELLVTCRQTLNRLRADRDSLREHRKGIVRAFARTAGLAYGFLKGHTYKEMEPKRYSDPNWDAIAKMVEKYGARGGILQDRMQAFEQWKQEAGEPAKRT